MVKYNMIIDTEKKKRRGGERDEDVERVKRRQKKCVIDYECVRDRERDRERERDRDNEREREKER